MTSYLLDTSVLSEMAPGRRSLPPTVSEWLLVREAQLHLSVMTLVEIEAGIAKLRRVGGGHRADRLSAWVDRLTREFGRRMIAVDDQLARAIGDLSDRVTAIGRHPGLADVAIAATARLRGMTLLTRNTKHFEHLQVRFVDPFERLP